MKVILVIGASRSGTTFLGKILSLGDKTKYVHEPVKPILQAKWIKTHSTLDIDAFWSTLSKPEQLRFGMHALAVVTIYLAIKYGRENRTFIIKPIVLLDGFEQAAKLTRAKVVFISRHPCGRAESIKRQWKLIGRGTETPLEDLKSTAVQWGESHKNAIDVFARYPGWAWIKFEDLCSQPQQIAEDLYHRFDLPWSPTIATSVKHMTSVHSDGFYDTNRNAELQIDKWKESLSTAEIEGIRDVVEKYKTALYEGF